MLLINSVCLCFIFVVYLVPAQIMYRSNPVSPVCVFPQQMQQVQQVPVGQSLFVPQQQFVAPVSNNNAQNRKFVWCFFSLSSFFIYQFVMHFFGTAFEQ